MLIAFGAVLVGTSALCFIVLMIGLARTAARPAPLPSAEPALIARPRGPRIANAHFAHARLSNAQLADAQLSERLGAAL